MKSLLLSSILATFMLTGCVLQESPCENVTVAAEQVQQCKVLQRQISQSKGNVVIRSELERRYQQDCVEIRYYRDAKQDAVCGNKKQIVEAKKARQEKLESK